MNKINNLIEFYKDYSRQKDKNKNSRIKYFNWCHPFSDPSEVWFSQFIISRKLLKDTRKGIAFFSIFGSPFSITLNRSDIKVFYTGENIHRNEFGHDFTRYKDNGLNKGFDLSLGFDYTNEDRYIRFPFWVLSLVNPAYGPAEIKSFCDQLSFHSTKNDQRRFCSLVSGHDPNGLRTQMYDSLSLIGDINSGGRLKKNTDELQTIYHNDKIKYLEQFKFNICPENSNTEGYVTEKIFQAIYSGSIPIYWGSNNNPEPDVLNKDAIIFWNPEGDNHDSLKLIQDLNNNPKLYLDFINQPRLQPHASGFITNMLNQLEMKLRQLLVQ